MFRGTVKRPKAVISAVYTAPDGTKVDLGVLAGDGRDAPENIEKARKAREEIEKINKKELKERRNG